MRRKFLFTLLILLFSLSVTSAYKLLKAEQSKMIKSSGLKDELMYFPNGQALRLISFGFDNTLADILWFQTVSYFGKHYRSDKNYAWLEHMCQVVTDLDPAHMDIYEFCSLLLAWENNKPQKAAQLLEKAINFKPDYWRNYYLRGMTSIIFKLDTDQALKDFIAASKLPDCPVFMKELASRKLGKLQSPEDTISFLKDMAERATEDSQKAALTERYKLALYEKNIIDLERYVESYQQQKGNLPSNLKNLSEIGIVINDFSDPFGGMYFITPEGKILSTSNKELLYLFKERPKNG